MHLLKNVCPCPSAGLSLHLQWWTNPTPCRRHRSYCGTPLPSTEKFYRENKKWGAHLWGCDLWWYFSNASIMRADFCMKFHTAVIKTTYPLSPRFVKIYLTRCSAIARDRAAGCVIVFAKSRRLELGDNILRTYEVLSSTTVI